MTIDNTKQARQAVSLIAGQILASLSEAIAPIIIIRFLPMTEVGILSAVLLIYSVLVPVFAAAFPHTLMYYMPTRLPAERKAIAIRVGLIMLSLGTLVGGIMLALGLVAILAPTTISNMTDKMVGGVSALGPAGLKYLIVLSLMPLGDFPVRILPNILVIEERHKTAAIVNVGKSLISLLSILVPILLHCNLWVIMASYSISGLLSGLLLVHYLRRLYPERTGKSVASDVTIRQLFNFAIPMGLNETVMLLYNKVDNFLIALAFPAFIVALYKAGAWQVPLVTTVAYSVGAVYAPHLRRLFSEGKPREAIELWKMSIKKVSLIVVPCGLIFVVGAEEIMEILFTGEYLPAANVFRLYCLLAVGRVAAFGAVLVAAGQPRFIFRVATISFTANILFSVPLMLLIGFEGPALGTVFAFLVHIAVFCWCIGKATHQPIISIFPLRDYLKTLSIGIISSTVAVFFKIHFMFQAGLMFACIAAIILVSFALLGTFLGSIKKEDWIFVTSLLLPQLPVKE